MNLVIQALLAAHDGVLSRAQVLDAVSRRAFEHAIASGHLISPFPQVCIDPVLARHPYARLRAALRYTGDRAAVSHLSALRLWDLPVPASTSGSIHLTTVPDLRLRAGRDLVVHRRVGFNNEPPTVTVRGGIPLTRVDTSLVDSWPLLLPGDRRAPAILAVQRRLITPRQLMDATVAVPNLPGRAQLLHLADLLVTGCRSELEIWGYQKVFRHPALPPAVHQLPIQLDTGTIYLDGAYRDEMLAVELDGRQYHSSPEQHERDLRRDSALAARGWLTVRFTHQRLRDPDSVIDELLAVLAMRRRQLRIA